MTRNSRKVALCYVRQSFTRDENDNNSPKRQKANIQMVCDREGWTPEWYVDAEGHKSGTDVKNRQAWQAMEQRFKDSDVVALVANDTNRLHRKFWRMGYLIELLEEYHVRLVFAAPNRQIDTSTPMGRMILNFVAMQDEAYAADISAKASDSVRHRKAQGKTIGMPPFGTERNDEGFLQPTSQGAWLLSDGRWIAGEENDDPPQPNAIWRGYYECAQRILEVFGENKHGKERVAYIVTDEGFAFRDRKGQPRAINKDDVRRVISNWMHYAGLSPEGKAKDFNASLVDDPVGLLYDTGRQVFPLELLKQVAETQKARSVTTRPTGSVRAAHPYPLTRLLYCAECERIAKEQNNPKYRSRLSGVNQNGKLRYRHAEGVKCGCKRRSVFKHVIEDDFGRLIKLLTINEDALPLMVELAVQSEHGGAVDDEDFEEQKAIAIAKCHRKIENAKFLFLEGDISKPEYLKRKEQSERQIAHWEARTTEMQQASIELAMCMEALENLARLWDGSDDEDKQEMARMLFEYIIYDLDQQRIVDFQLKPWADRYLTLRASLYDLEDPQEPTEDGGGENTEEAKSNNRPSVNQTSDLCPIGGLSAEAATSSGIVCPEAA